MGGTTIEAPEPTQPELDIQAAQAESLNVQNELLLQQIEAANETRDQLKELTALSDEDTASLKALQQSQVDIAQQSLDFQKQAFDDAAALRPLELEFRQQSLEQSQQQLDISKQQLDLFEAAINRPPTEAELLFDEVLLAQGEQALKGLRGELPVSVGTQQAKEREFGLLRENLTRRGINVEGSTLEGATSDSTVGVQALGDLKDRFALIEDQERRGAIGQGQSLFFQGQGQQFAQQSNLFGQQTGFLPNIPGISVASPTLSSFDVGSTLNQVGGAGLFGFGQSQSGFGSLQQGFSSALQPFQFQRNLEFEASQQNAANAASGISSLFGGIGSVVGAAAGGLTGAGGLFAQGI